LCCLFFSFVVFFRLDVGTLFNLVRFFICVLGCLRSIFYKFVLGGVAPRLFCFLLIFFFLFPSGVCFYDFLEVLSMFGFG